MEHTADQKRAVETHTKNLIVVAGAGSGKTRVLVDRYLALLEKKSDWPLNALVAITFTRKAAGEMRDRVRDALQERLQKAADTDKARWSNLLATMDGARIDTIHGLCASILRANAAEAEIDPDFTVLDETEARILLDDVVDATLQQLVAEGDAAIRLFTEYDNQNLIYTTLAQSELLATDFPPLPDDLIAHWQGQWERDAEQFLTGFRYFIDHDAETFDPVGENTLAERWQDCLNVLDRLKNTVDREERLEILRDLAAIKIPGGKIAQDWGDVGNDAREALKKIIGEAKANVKAIGEPPTSELDYRAAELLPLWMALVQRVQAAYRQAKREQGWLDFNDLENMTCDLLTNVADVRARYQSTEFKHLLVDEFQDTNTKQWEIIQALADLNQAGSLFVVGDPKQSIYQFRGANVSVFDRVKGQITDTGGDEIPLAESFRTHIPLVNCFNAVFGKLLVRDARSPVKDFQVTLGKPMISKRPAPDNAPILECLVIDRSQKDADGKSLNTESARPWEAYEIAQRLKTMVAEEVRVWDKEKREHRPVMYGDMALLFQATTQITLYEEVFKAQGLPFVTIAGRGYYSRQEVWDMLNLLRALHNPADNLSLAVVLRSPLFNLSDDALLALRFQVDENGQRLLLWQALQQPEGIPESERGRVAFARDCLNELHKSAGRVTIAELLRLALSRTGYLATLTALPDGARRRGNIEKLIEKAEASGKITLGAFTEYLDDLSTRESREGEAALETKGAVTLMTVHASKGLEFPVVVLADASWTRKGGGGGIIIPSVEDGLACKVYDTNASETKSPFSYRRAATREKLLEEAERKRLLYVAATRAQDYLIVSGQGSRNNDGKFGVGGWLKQIWELLELGDEIHPQAEPISIAYDWGNVRLMMPNQIPDREAFILSEAQADSTWESAAIRTGEALPGTDEKPLLLNPVEVERDAPARHLSATQIADIGAAGLADNPKDREFYRDRIRKRIFYDAPAHIPTITDQSKLDDTQVPKYKIGEMVHEVLRYWRFPTAENDLTAMLESYAWKQGIINPNHRRSAIRQARQLLTGFVGTKVYDWVQEAQQLGQPIYYELPFIYRTEKRTIHGIIDLLFQRSDSVWVIVDYKTSFVQTTSDSRVPRGDEIAAHARRYHLQIGVYAAAVQAQLGGVIPETYIHYIRYSRAIPIAAEDWREALENLENLIGSIV